METAKQLAGRTWRHFMHDSLYRNSIFLMLSTAIMSTGGFLFWIICAHLYSPHEVGLATTLISAVALISSLSLLGYNNSLIRYLGKDANKSPRVNTSLTLVCVVAVMFSLIFLAGLSVFSPKLLFVRENMGLLLLFVAAAGLTVSSTIIDSTFIAHRKGEYVLTKNALMTVSKLIIPFVLISLGAVGIFTATTLAVALAYCVGVSILLFVFKIKLKPQISLTLASQMRKFSLANYAASFIENSSSTILPILITNALGASSSGYFYIAMMFASALYVIPIAMSQTLFAEGSSTSQDLLPILKKAARFIFAVLIPAVAIIAILGKVFLGLFGQEYSTNSYVPLLLLVAAGIPVTVKLLANVIFNIEHKVGYIIVTNIITVSSVLGLSTLLLDHGLMGVAIAWLIGEGMGALAAVMFLFLRSDTLKSHSYRQRASDLYNSLLKISPLS